MGRPKRDEIEWPQVTSEDTANFSGMNVDPGDGATWFMMARPSVARTYAGVSMGWIPGAAE